MGSLEMLVNNKKKKKEINGGSDIWWQDSQRSWVFDRGKNHGLAVLLLLPELWENQYLSLCGL